MASPLRRIGRTRFGRREASGCCRRRSTWPWTRPSTACEPLQASARQPRFDVVLRPSPKLEEIDRRHARERLAERSYVEALAVFTALWLEAASLDPDFPGSWRDDLAPDRLPEVTDAAAAARGRSPTGGRSRRGLPPVVGRGVRPNAGARRDARAGRGAVPETRVKGIGTWGNPTWAYGRSQGPTTPR